MMAVGKRIYGYCNGLFGRDSFEDRRIEAFGIDWVVCRDDEGVVEFCSFDSNEEMVQCIEKWGDPKESYNHPSNM